MDNNFYNNQTGQQIAPIPNQQQVLAGQQMAPIPNQQQVLTVQQMAPIPNQQQVLTAQQQQQMAMMQQQQMAMMQQQQMAMMQQQQMAMMQQQQMAMMQQQMAEAQQHAMEEKVEQFKQADEKRHEIQAHMQNVVSSKYAFLIFVFCVAQVVLLTILGIAENVLYVTLPIAVPFIVEAVEFGVTYFSTKYGTTRYGGMVLAKVFNIIYLVLTVLFLGMVIVGAWFSSLIFGFLVEILAGDDMSAGTIAFSTSFAVIVFILIMAIYIFAIILFINLISIRSNIKAALQGKLSKNVKTIFTAVNLFMLCVPILGTAIYIVVYTLKLLLTLFKAGHALALICAAIIVLLFAAEIALGGVLFIYAENSPNKKLAAYKKVHKERKEKLHEIREGIRHEVEKAEAEQAAAKAKSKKKGVAEEDTGRTRLKVNNK